MSKNQKLQFKNTYAEFCVIAYNEKKTSVKIEGYCDARFLPNIEEEDIIENLPEVEELLKERRRQIIKFLKEVLTQKKIVTFNVTDVISFDSKMCKYWLKVAEEIIQEKGEMLPHIIKIDIEEHQAVKRFEQKLKKKNYKINP